MKARFRPTLAGVAALAAAGGFLLVGAGAAHAATSPSYEPDPNSLGTVSFYDKNGVQVTSGSLTSAPFVPWLKASTDAPSGSLKAIDAFYTPVKGALPATWQTGEQQSSGQAFPQASAPGSLSSATAPVVHDDGGLSFQDHIDDFTSSDTDDPNVYQVRIAVTPSGKYWATDILINPNTETWTQLYPAPPAGAVSTGTTLGAAPSPATVGQSVTLTATVAASSGTSKPVGSVQFKDGSTNIGSPVAVDGTGTATTSTSTLAQGSHSLSAVFTPTDSTAFGGSTGAATEVVNAAPATATTTTLGVSGNTSIDGNDETFTASVNPSAAPGSVAFYDNGASTPIAGTVVKNGSQYTLTVTGGLGVGDHSVIAKFTPTDSTVYGASQSAAATFHTSSASGACAQYSSSCTDPQNVQATVPTGTLVINTPYTSSAPLDLGTLALDPSGKYFTGQKAFQNITVTDARSGALPWTASALSSALTDGGSKPGSTINAENLGLTGLVATPGAGYTGTVTTVSNPAATGVAPTDTGSAGLGGTSPHTIATSTGGPGTVTMNGTLTLNAPSSTEAGLFKGVITFTVG